MTNTMHVEAGIYVLSEYFYNGGLYVSFVSSTRALPNLLFHPVNHYDVAYDKCVRGN